MPRKECNMKSASEIAYVDIHQLVQYHCVPDNDLKKNTQSFAGELFRTLSVSNPLSGGKDLEWEKI